MRRITEACLGFCAQRDAKLICPDSQQTVDVRRSSIFVAYTEEWRFDMPLIQVVLVLIVVGLLLWLIDRFVPMAGSIKSILNAVVVIAVVLWLLNVFGLLSSLSAIHVGR
jgi:hypothetical protein